MVRIWFNHLEPPVTSPVLFLSPTCHSNISLFKPPLFKPRWCTAHVKSLQRPPCSSEMSDKHHPTWRSGKSKTSGSMKSFCEVLQCINLLIAMLFLQDFPWDALFVRASEVCWYYESLDHRLWYQCGLSRVQTWIPRVKHLKWLWLKSAYIRRGVSLGSFSATPVHPWAEICGTISQGTQCWSCNE